MSRKFDVEKILRWVPVVIAATVAGLQTYWDQEDAERMDDMNTRIEKLEGSKK